MADMLRLNAYQPNATARKVVQLLPGFSTVDANGQSRPFQTSVVGGTTAPPVVSGDSVVVTTRSDYELGASGNLLSLHTVDNFGRDEREFHHEFGFVDNLGNRTLFVRDMLGSTRAVLKNGTMVEWNDYYAYGAVRDGKSLINGRWQYLGAEADNETGTLHLHAREYDFFTGFNQIDPLWAKYPSLSPYTYGAQNPFKYKDPSGREIIITVDRTNTEGLPVIHIRVTGKLVDDTKKFSQEQLKKYADEMKAGIEATYKGVGDGFEFMTTVDLSVATEDNPLSKTDHAFRISSEFDIAAELAYQNQMRDKNVIGLAGRNIDNDVRDRVILFNEAKIRNVDRGRLAAHEIGHAMGLNHADDVWYDSKNRSHTALSLEQEKGNVMEVSGRGRKVMSSQVRKAEMMYRQGKLNGVRQR